MWLSWDKTADRLDWSDENKILASLTPVLECLNLGEADTGG
jgi:hypothetical protein